ncbi:hypothetical protein HPB50_001001 [Hyalomma asiaticum]|uniref:Uncharacterized protein n=1 Tax=Hyalomma asiaticum TaxID=266040 RepID=A0ACB7SNW0_HYAAI|nr:hypothetical protein HPB50_001001 [Hyalomma asiaticum]
MFYIAAERDFGIVHDPASRTSMQRAVASLGAPLDTPWPDRRSRGASGAFYVYACRPLHPDLARVIGREKVAIIADPAYRTPPPPPYPQSCPLHSSRPFYIVREATETTSWKPHELQTRSLACKQVCACARIRV